MSLPLISVVKSRAGFLSRSGSKAGNSMDLPSSDSPNGSHSPDGGSPTSEKGSSTPKKSQLSHDGARDSEAVFTLINGILGGGILGYPFAFRQCGLGVATGLLLLCFCACQMSMQLLLASSQLSNRRSIEDLATHCFGRPGRLAVQFCIFSLNMGALVAYTNILADVLSSVAGTVVPPGAEPSRNVLMAGITFLAALPTALLVRSPAVLAVVSQVSVWFVIIFALVIGVISMSPVLHNSGPLSLWKPEGAFISFPLLAYGFTSQQFLFGVYHSLRSPSVQRMTGVVKQALTVCAVLYIIVGACGYMAFRDRTAGDVLRNFGGKNVPGLRGIYERVLKMGYGFSIIASVPLIMGNFQSTLLPPLAALFPLDPSAPKGTTIQEQGLTVAVLGTALVLAVAVPNVEFIFGLVGSTASVFIAYVLPALLFLHLSSRSALLRQLDPADVATGPLPWVQWLPSRSKAYGLMCFGLLAGVLCTRATLMALHTEVQVVSLAKELVQQEQQVQKAVSNEAKAVQVAAAFQGIDQAALKLAGTRKEAAATMDAVAQAAAAFTGLVNVSLATNATASGNSSSVSGDASSGTQKQEADEAAEKAASSNALALGAVNMNLANLRRRVNKALVDMQLITTNLGIAIERVEAHQLDLRAFSKAVRAGKDAPGWSFFRHNLTGSRVEDLPPGRGAAAAMMLAANGSRTASAAWEAREGQKGKGSVEAEEARQLQELTVVQQQANATVSALMTTSRALDDVEAAAADVERAKGRADAEEKLEAAKAMQRAIAVASKSTAGIARIAKDFESLQVHMAADLKQLVGTLSREARDAAAEALQVAGSNALRGTGMMSRRDKDGDWLVDEADLSKDGNLTKAALVAVDLATQAVDAALRHADVITAKANISQEVALQAEAIAKELTTEQQAVDTNVTAERFNVHALL